MLVKSVTASRQGVSTLVFRSFRSADIAVIAALCSSSMKYAPELANSRSAPQNLQTPLEVGPAGGSIIQWWAGASGQGTYIYRLIFSLSLGVFLLSRRATSPMTGTARCFSISE